MMTSIPHNVALEGTSDEYTPRKENKFTFGLWTVGNRGRDPFGDFVRPDLPPVRSVQKLSELGAYGISLHDNDLVPFGASAAERERIVREFKQALADYSMVVPMAQPISSFILFLRTGRLPRLILLCVPLLCKKPCQLLISG